MRVAAIVVLVACSPGSRRAGDPVAAFDHARVGWRLDGAHLTATCDRCHPDVDARGLRVYAGADRACASCHAASHAGHLFGQPERTCQACHRTAAAEPAPRFVRHDAFVLGAHWKLPCLDCHTQALGTATPDPVCHRCHTDDNPHGDRFRVFGPPACGACHVVQRWSTMRFKHGLQTTFELWPMHGQLECRACHRGEGPQDFEKLASHRKCKSCHAHANVHADHEFTNRQCVLCHQASQCR
jgi:hypothetical protein